MCFKLYLPCMCFKLYLPCMDSHTVLCLEYQLSSMPLWSNTFHDWNLFEFTIFFLCWMFVLSYEPSPGLYLFCTSPLECTLPVLNPFTSIMYQGITRLCIAAPNWIVITLLFKSSPHHVQHVPAKNIKSAHLPVYNKRKRISSVIQDVASSLSLLCMFGVLVRKSLFRWNLYESFSANASEPTSCPSCSVVFYADAFGSSTYNLCSVLTGDSPTHLQQLR